ncbi:MAG: DUF1819 family protein [Candidatus Aminicenantes bacterium]|nr:DUF1819 family protein [Candidatus Aminicenantes bacterium]NIM80588.1 DUF1819 family protein [Candidatus Aminicenantes bacterium]NIN19969.1 DUF1819 family protein [Candidatus Aminicenantes bacterium]NIN42597.1 DUF1819 family protein [Candidatus Aminicenantes bacterium]NIN86595.1 DUF1819 family protein [Candidatus Aminicenantes bacterium]
MMAKQNRDLRDKGPYSARNTVGISLLEETGLVMKRLISGLTLNQVRQQAVDGQLLRQKTRETRRTLWERIYYRLFSHQIEWVIHDLKESYEQGPQSAEFISFLYLHYALSDRLTYDFVVNVVWEHWYNGNIFVSRDDILFLLDEVSEQQPQVRRWTEKSKHRLSSTILSALRDFGLLKGVKKKEIMQPGLPLFNAEHILRLLTFEGKRGNEVLSDSTWKLFLLTTDDVAHILSRLAQNNRIRFERVGSTTVLETPLEWETRNEN